MSERKEDLTLKVTRRDNWDANRDREHTFEFEDLAQRERYEHFREVIKSGYIKAIDGVEFLSGTDDFSIAKDFFEQDKQAKGLIQEIEEMQGVRIDFDKYKQMSEKEVRAEITNQRNAAYLQQHARRTAQPQIRGNTADTHGGFLQGAATQIKSVDSFGMFGGQRSSGDQPQHVQIAEQKPVEVAEQPPSIEPPQNKPLTMEFAGKDGIHQFKFENTEQRQRYDVFASQSSFTNAVDTAKDFFQTEKLINESSEFINQNRKDLAEIINERREFLADMNGVQPKVSANLEGVSQQELAFAIKMQGGDKTFNEQKQQHEAMMSQMSPGQAKTYNATQEANWANVDNKIAASVENRVNSNGMGARQNEVAKVGEQVQRMPKTPTINRALPPVK